MTESENVPGSEEAGKAPVQARNERERYWSSRFVLMNSVLLLLAAVAGYLEYIAYPALMTSATPPVGTGFGETNVVLSISFLTYRFSATNPNCLNSGCVLPGVPAFDFCQALIYLVILINLVRLVRLRSG